MAIDLKTRQGMLFCSTFVGNTIKLAVPTVIPKYSILKFNSSPVSKSAEKRGLVKKKRYVENRKIRVIFKKNNGAPFE